METWDFALLVDAPRSDLYRELAATHSELANIHEEIAFNKATEATDKTVRPARLQLEGRRDALIEKKFLLIRLLDAASE